MILDSNDIQRYELVQKRKLQRISENEAYVLGKNPTIYKQPIAKTPDNRIPVPLAKSAVEDMTGYAATVGNIQMNYVAELDLTDQETAKLDEYKSLNKRIYNHNDADLETSELYSQSLSQGESYELFWVSDDLDLESGILTPEFTMIDNREIVLVYDNSIKKALSTAIRFWNDTAGIKHADAYYAGFMQSFVKIEDNEKKDFWMRNEDGDTVYPYTSVPLAVYKSDRNSQPLFEAQKEIIDAHDNLLSKSVNEIDRFNALVMLLPGKVDANFITKLKDSKIIDDLDEFEKWPEYLEKNLTSINAFYNDLADRLENLYYSTIKVPDFSDESFAGNSSGIAIKYKIMGLEFKAAMIDGYFYAGLQQRQKLINQVLSSGTKTFDSYKTKVDGKRNLPKDYKTIAETVKNLVGVVSKQTLLNFLPNEIVSDAELELELIDKENGVIDLENL